MLCLHLPVLAVAAGAFLAGAGSATFGTYFSTVMPRRVPEEMLARATAFGLTGAYALGSVGFAVIGPAAAVFGAGRLLGFAAAYAALSSTIVLSLRAIRSVGSGCLRLAGADRAHDAGLRGADRHMALPGSL
jgi:hypothetical protein